MQSFYYRTLAAPSQTSVHYVGCFSVPYHLANLFSFIAIVLRKPHAQPDLPSVRSAPWALWHLSVPLSLRGNGLL